MTERLSEQSVSDSFHSYLKSSLAQAKAERLLDEELLSSAEGDVMITGPALCLYFAALRCTTHPPSVPLPRKSKIPGSVPVDLSEENCPEPFIRFLRVWGNNVRPIQALPPDLQHDLARTICGLPPISSRSSSHLGGIAADLRAVAIEIGQRRTFQERYEADLQAALDSGTQNGSAVKVKAKFAPPPMYEDAVSESGESSSAVHRPSRPLSSSSSTPYSREPSRSPARSDASGSSSASSRSILPEGSPAIDFIRETLYAALADVIAETPAVAARLRSDPPRAYFSSVGLAILMVASTSVTVPPVSPASQQQFLTANVPQTGPQEVFVTGVLGQKLKVEDCPPPLRPLMRELGELHKLLHAIEEEDLKEAMDAAAHGRASYSRVENIRKTLEEGVGWDAGPRRDSDNGSSGRRSIEGRSLSFVNRINALTFSLTSLGTFRDRQEDVFKVLAGVV